MKIILGKDGERYLSGRNDGETYKKKLEKQEGDKIKILIKKNVIGINMSFFLGMFDEILSKFKNREEIEEKIKFEIEDSEYKELVQEDIDTAINEILDNISIKNIIKGK